MRFLPVAERELRIASRRAGTYRIRWVSALFALVISTYLYWVMSRMVATGQAARQLFTLLARVGFLYCLFAGVRWTSDSLSREKREGTMGFLFLTPLRSYDIVVGKLLASSLRVVYAPVAVVPILAVCLIVGGVQSGEFWRMVLALFNTLFFSLAIGLLVSAALREERRAGQTTGAIVLLCGIVLPALGEYLRSRTSAVGTGLFLRMLSPVHALDFSSVSTASVRSYWWSLLVVHGLGWLALGLACWILPRSWQDRPQKVSVPWRERLWRTWFERGDQRKAFRMRHLDQRPIYWLAARSPGLLVETWLAFLAVLVVAGVAAWLSWGKIPLYVIWIMAAVTLHTLLKLQICSAACDPLAAAKQDGTLEVLLSTPLAVDEILRGHWFALFRVIVAPILVLLVLELGVQAAMRDPIAGPAPPSDVVYLFLMASSAALLMDLMTLGWVGMWQAVAARNARDARSKTLLCVLILPWVLLVLWLSLKTLSPFSPGARWQQMLWMWALLGTASTVGFTLWARTRLYESFRWMAAQRYQSQRLESWSGASLQVGPGPPQA